MIRIFIGYDKRETVTYHVLAHTILKHSTEPVSVTPLVRSQLPVNPTRDPKASTDFADTRFLVPWLCNYEGWAIFMDCDEMFTVDPKELWDLRDERFAVIVRKHLHTPENERKFLNSRQFKYKYKNWSSLMLFNNEKCKVLDPAYINATPGLDLHQFTWLSGEHEIGELSYGWNHLAGEYHYTEAGEPMVIHFTTGSPCFAEYRYTPYAKQWWDAYKDMTHCDQS